MFTALSRGVISFTTMINKKLQIKIVVGPVADERGGGGMISDQIC